MYFMEESEYYCMHKRFALSSLLIVALLVAFSGCVKKSNEDQGSAQTGQVRGVPEVTTVTKRQDLVPNFTWKDPAGKTTTFDAFKGKVTLINFWATWCVPCKKELPDLVAISKEMSDKGVKVLGISTDRGSNVGEEVASFVQENQIPYQIIVSNEDLEEAFGNIRAIPTSFLVNADGKIVQSFIGGRTKEFFAQAIADAMK